MGDIKEIDRQTWFDWANEMIKDCGDWEQTEGMSEDAYNKLMATAAAMIENDCSEQKSPQ